MGCAGQKWQAAISSNIVTMQLYYKSDSIFLCFILLQTVGLPLFYLKHLVFKVTFSLVGSFLNLLLNEPFKLNFIM